MAIVEYKTTDNAVFRHLEFLHVQVARKLRDQCQFGRSNGLSFPRNGKRRDAQSYALLYNMVIWGSIESTIEIDI